MLKHALRERAGRAVARGMEDTVEIPVVVGRQTKWVSGIHAGTTCEVSWVEQCRTYFTGLSHQT